MKTDLQAIFVILVLLILFSINSFAAIPVEQKSLDIHQVMAAFPESTVTQEDIAAIIPTDIPAGSSNGTVGKMVLDKAIKSALKSDLVKSSSVAQTAETLKDGINTEMAIGGDSANPDAVQHKIKVKVDPIQTRARLQYTGYFNATAAFDAGDTQVEIYENFENYRLNITHIKNDTEDLSLVQVQIPW